MIEWTLLTKVRKRKLNTEIPDDFKKPPALDRQENRSLLSSASDRIRSASKKEYLFMKPFLQDSNLSTRDPSAVKKRSSQSLSLAQTHKLKLYENVVHKFNVASRKIVKKVPVIDTNSTALVTRSVKSLTQGTDHNDRNDLWLEAEDLSQNGDKQSQLDTSSNECSRPYTANIMPGQSTPLHRRAIKDVKNELPFVEDGQRRISTTAKAYFKPKILYPQTKYLIEKIESTIIDNMNKKNRLMSAVNIKVMKNRVLKEEITKLDLMVDISAYESKIKEIEKEIDSVNYKIECENYQKEIISNMISNRKKTLLVVQQPYNEYATLVSKITRYINNDHELFFRNTEEIWRIKTEYEEIKVAQSEFKTRSQLLLCDIEKLNDNEIEIKTISSAEFVKSQQRKRLELELLHEKLEKEKYNLEEKQREIKARLAEYRIVLNDFHKSFSTIKAYIPHLKYPNNMISFVGDSRENKTFLEDKKIVLEENIQQEKNKISILESKIEKLKEPNDLNSEEEHVRRLKTENERLALARAKFNKIESIGMKLKLFKSNMNHYIREVGLFDRELTALDKESLLEFFEKVSEHIQKEKSN